MANPAPAPAGRPLADRKFPIECSGQTKLATAVAVAAVAIPIFGLTTVAISAGTLLTANIAIKCKKRIDEIRIENIKRVEIAEENLRIARANLAAAKAAAAAEEAAAAAKAAAPAAGAAAPAAGAATNDNGAGAADAADEDENQLKLAIALSLTEAAAAKEKAPAAARAPAAEAAKADNGAGAADADDDHELAKAIALSLVPSAVKINPFKAGGAAASTNSKFHDDATGGGGGRASPLPPTADDFDDKGPINIDGSGKKPGLMDLLRDVKKQRLQTSAATINGAGPASDKDAVAIAKARDSLNNAIVALNLFVNTDDRISRVKPFDELNNLSKQMGRNKEEFAAYFKKIEQYIGLSQIAANNATKSTKKDELEKHLESIFKNLEDARKKAVSYKDQIDFGVMYRTIENNKTSERIIYILRKLIEITNASSNAINLALNELKLDAFSKLDEI